MLKVLTAEQMREVDRLTTELYGIPSIILMENAAHAVARVITEKLGSSVKGKSVLILCGKGNNGGDGAALARILMQQGAAIELLLFSEFEDVSGDALVNFNVLRNLSGGYYGNARRFVGAWFGNKEIGSLTMELCPTESEWLDNKQHIEKFAAADILVDAVLGTGLTRAIGGLYASVVNWVNILSSQVPIVPYILSIDIPSGLNSDSGIQLGESISADGTVTFGAPKVGNVLTPAANQNGELTIADIGLPGDLIDEQDSKLFVSEALDAEKWLENSTYSTDSYKNKRGHALIFAGSDNYSGAAVMCGNSAMRSGVGLTTLLVPASCKVEVASRVIPEVIVGTIGDNTEDVAKADSIVIGPGLDANDGLIEWLVREIVASRKVPVILDAGALWFCNPPDGLLKEGTSRGEETLVNMRVERRAPLILTPHEGEFLRLLGTEDKGVLKDRVAAVRDFAVSNDVILVLKGERVLIGSPDGRVVVNPTGNSGLGKAGNGDTLAGILAGFVAQASKIGIDIFDTVVAAVYVAGMAGDVAERKFGKRAMTASDVRECLVDVFADFEKTMS